VLIQALNRPPNRGKSKQWRRRFPLKLYSKVMKPVTLPPGPRPAGLYIVRHIDFREKNVGYVASVK
jgi:hypothetical protein